MVEESFGVKIARISCIVFELCISGKKERKNKEKKKSKIVIFILNFLTVRMINETLGLDQEVR